MSPDEYDIMYRVEDSHWWYKGMERITRTVLDRWYPRSQRLHILDAGCGTGAAVAGYLADYGRVTAFDAAPSALNYCSRRRIRCLTCASVVSIPFRSAFFDLVTSFDVLSERWVSNDLAALKEFYRVLAPGGRLLLRLPALKWLRGQHDRAVNVSHRYTRHEVVEKLEGSGFSVQLISYANTLLFPVIWLKRWGDRILTPPDHASDLTLSVGPVNRLLADILACEAPFVARSRLPIGVSVIAVGQKL
jgi:ubiquinone/menaquinone biosynthesis C-methylase UbiE